MAAGTPDSEHRRHPRRRTRLRTGKIADADNRFLSECTIFDVSAGGARLMVPEHLNLPAEIILFDDLEKTVALASVRWRRGNQVGIQYEVTPASLRYFASPKLRSLAQRYYARTD
ncbi:PilZ domain-containing protein [Polymorphum gilvum]|uniref:Type IV pilus assembly protein PilZ n=1 Tax=Polymorphum gilvum (strain LMG 25793 / CGMCC 1.9160 / SL003B-26A1) TaxID=991905 RepID=F2IVV3_POLGS|nr:PilZ domain-containing protein [Polymorphum gilvum]ADZ69210.1 Type IV pilus assembly protein PilZ [Polymorphum gilvum SL003B-26A1]